MRSFRSKPVGWQHDNYRHYLAAKYGSAGRYPGLTVNDRETPELSDYEMEDIAKKEGVPLLRRPDFMVFMKERFPDEPLHNGIVSKWAGKFAEGREWETGDEKSREVLRDVNPKKYGYYMTKEKAREWSDSIKSFFDDGRAQTPDYNKLHRDQLAQEEYERVKKELQFKESDGNLRTGTTERFLEDDFTNETKDFLDKKIDYTTYRSNIDRRLKKHKEQYDSKLHVFGW